MTNAPSSLLAESGTALFLRSPVARTFDYRGSTSILGAGGEVQFAGDRAKVVRLVLELLDKPRGRTEVIETASAVVSGNAASLIDEVLSALLRGGAVVKVAADGRPLAAAASKDSSPRRRLCLAISGAVANLFAPALIQILLDSKFTVRVAMTKSATQFLNPRALETLTHCRVFSDLWDGDQETPVPHINLATWAELVLVWPASATTLSRLANGDHSELVSSIALVARGPVVVVPSMNSAMYRSPSVRRNLAQLRDDGFFVVHSGFGYEYADPPEHRTLMPGPSPPISVIGDIVSFIIKQHAHKDSRAGAANVAQDDGPFPRQMTASHHDDR